MRTRKQHDPERNAVMFLSGQLRTRVRRRLERHLLDCEDCWEEFLLGRRGKLLAERAREIAPSWLRERVRASVATAEFE
ncbi:MAG: hypothetical protein WD050_03185 [Actinomycetota bacterium]